MTRPAIRAPTEQAHFFCEDQLRLKFQEGGLLLDAPGYKIDAGRREHPGEVEHHEHVVDVKLVVDGFATVITGGKMLDPREVGPGEGRRAARTTWSLTPRARTSMTRAGALAPADTRLRLAHGRVCFNWYRVNVTVPERVGELDPTGCTLLFEVAIDDHAEVWVERLLQLALGDSDSPVVGGFELVADDLPDPGGLAFSPDERHLYIANAEPDAKVIKRYDLRDDGSSSSGTVFYDLTDPRGEAALDGLKVDRERNVYACGRVASGSSRPTPSTEGTLVLPEELHNLVWGGDDGRTLYVTARTCVSRIGLLIPGIRPEWERRLQ